MNQLTVRVNGASPRGFLFLLRAPSETAVHTKGRCAAEVRKLMINTRKSTLVVLTALLVFVLVSPPPAEAGSDSTDRDRPTLRAEALLRAHGPSDDYSDDESSDDEGDDGECVILCHKPGTAAEQTLCVPESAVNAHLRHGDHLGECEDDAGPNTILDALLDIDGAQALVAAVSVVDESPVVTNRFLGSEPFVCPEGIGDMLANPEANLVLFAPSNRAWEKLFRQRRGEFDGLGIEEIAFKLPELLDAVELSVDGLCELLLNHLAMGEDDPGSSSVDALLERGEITIANQEVFPISVGSGDVAINYESEISKGDIIRSNGIIHFLNSVIRNVPPPGDDAVRVFVTRGVYSGDLGGLAGADEKCTASATAAGLGGTWVAWLSNETADARDRIPEGEYRLVDETTIVANDLADLIDGTLKNSIEIDENGNPWSQNVWTGTQPDGELYTDAFGASETCNDWTDGTNDFDGVTGNSGAVDGNWTTFGNQAPLTPQLSPCNGFRSLYCFEASE
jgi:hypothetical protein